MSAYQRDRRRGTDRAVAAGHAEYPCSRRGLAQLCRQVPASVCLDDRGLGKSAASQLASFDDAVPAEVFTSRTSPSPVGAAGACRGGLIAMAGLSGRQRKVITPAADPMAVPASTSDG